MDQYAGIDVSLKASAVCVMDATGKIVREGTVASEPEALIAWFQSLPVKPARIGLEAGPLSQWLYAALRNAGFAVELLETRQLHTVLKMRPVKTDRNDARGIADLMRVGWFRPVHCKSVAAQEMRALMATRKLLQVKLNDIEMHLRGILRGFGLKVGATTKPRFAERIRELATGQPMLERIAEATLAAREVLLREFKAIEKQARGIARTDTRARLLMSAPGVGPIVSLGYVATIDDPSRFKSSKAVGPYLGITPRKYQSGETDYDGRISKLGDKSLRALLYDAAHTILTRPIKGGYLKSWAAKLARRRGIMKAKVALARRLAVILHRMLVTGTAFRFEAPTQPAAATA
jgi:transposase